MKSITVYSTEPCGHCRDAKALLQKRGVDYEEINLAKDPDGRAKLAQRTGLMSFPQVVIEGRTLGGFRELVELDRSGGLKAFAGPATA
jgi:glutaredoxin 3